MSSVWLITGTSSGLGRVLALRALKAGHRVVGTVRSRSRSAQVVDEIESAGGKIVELDLTEPQANIIQKVQEAESIYGRIDYLINNAGYSLLGPAEVFTAKEVEHQIQTCIFGPVYTVQAVLPGMRGRQSGTIVNVSSVAGQDAVPSCGLYAASKFGLEGFTEALSKEVKDFGINVLIVEPGAFRTNFLTAAVQNDKGIPEAYRGTPVDKAVQAFGNMNGKQTGDVTKGVERIFEVVTGQGMGGKLTGKVLRVVLGEDAYVRVSRKIDTVKKDMELGKEVAFSTAMED